MIVHHAAWVLPIAQPPIRDGWVAVDRRRIVAVGGPGDPRPANSGPAEPPNPGAPEPSSRAILPALVNAHTHLELSWLRGRVPPASAMPVWAARLMAVGRTDDADRTPPIAAALHEVRACGTVLLGDVTNTLLSYELLANSPLSASVFYELLGFNAPDPAGKVADAEKRLGTLTRRASLCTSIVPHAPYSVSVELFAAIAAASAGRVMSVHVGESAEEMQFLRDGTGPWKALLQDLGAWSPRWTPPACGPVEYLDRVGLVGDRLLAVHAVQLVDRELDRLAAAGATIVTCPRSNAWTGAGTPPVGRFFASGARVAVGTDSLASADDLSVFSELRALRAVAPGVPAARLLDSATRSGAVALGFGDELGTIQAGKRAELLAVRVPDDVADVEEYLLGGIQPDTIRWLDGG